MFIVIRIHKTREIKERVIRGQGKKRNTVQQKQSEQGQTGPSLHAMYSSSQRFYEHGRRIVACVEVQDEQTGQCHTHSHRHTHTHTHTHVQVAQWPRRYNEKTGGVRYPSVLSAGRGNFIFTWPYISSRRRAYRTSINAQWLFIINARAAFLLSLCL